MKSIVLAALAATLVSGTAVMAQPNPPGRNEQDLYENYRNDPNVHMTTPRYSRGDRVPEQYRQNQQYVVSDWQQRHLKKPPRGYHWVRDDNNNYFLAAVTTGIILDLLLNSH